MRERESGLGVPCAVDGQIVGYAHQPCAELAGLLVLVVPDGYYCAGKCILEHVLCRVLVLADEEYVGVHIILMPAQQLIKCFIVALFIQFGQVMVGHCIQFVHHCLPLLIWSSFFSIGNVVYVLWLFYLFL